MFQPSRSRKIRWPRFFHSLPVALGSIVGLSACSSYISSRVSRFGDHLLQSRESWADVGLRHSFIRTRRHVGRGFTLFFALTAYWSFWHLRIALSPLGVFPKAPPDILHARRNCEGLIRKQPPKTRI